MNVDWFFLYVISKRKVKQRSCMLGHQSWVNDIGNFAEVDDSFKYCKNISSIFCAIHIHIGYRHILNFNLHY